MAKFLVTDKIHPCVEPVLQAMGFEVDWLPNILYDEVVELIPNYVGLIINSKTKIDKPLIDRAKQLKVIGRVGSGMEHVDRVYCEEQGIATFNSPEGNCNAVAEHAMAMLLALSNNLIRANNEVKQGIWKRWENTGFELRYRKVGIIGFGNTGSHFAEKMIGFVDEVMVYDKYKSGFETDFVKEVSYETLIANCDIISFHLPYNEETHHWIDADFINSLQPNTILINTSRGAIANTKDILWALQNDKLGGLCLDVFEDEPITKGATHDFSIYEQIMSFDNVVVSPHIAGWTGEAKEKMVRILLDKIADYLKISS